jgi:hypothetical protein
VLARRDVAVRPLFKFDGFRLKVRRLMASSLRPDDDQSRLFEATERRSDGWLTPCH